MTASAEPVRASHSTDLDAEYIRMELGKGEVSESKAEAYYRQGLEHYRNAGKRLAKVRNACRVKGHQYYANWLGWLNDNGIKQQRASECIRLSEGWEKLPPGGGFGLKEALRIIAEAKAEENQPADAPPDEPEVAEAAPAEMLAAQPSEEASQPEAQDDGSRIIAPLGMLGANLSSEVAAWVAKIKRARGYRDNESAVHAALQAMASGIPDEVLRPRRRRDIYLTTAVPDHVLASLEGTLPDPDLCSRIVNDDADVYRPDGTLLFALRRRAVPCSVWSGASRFVSRHATKVDPKRGRRKAVAGQENFRSGTRGFMRGKLTGQTRRDRWYWPKLCKLVSEMETVFRRERPNEYERHREAIADVPAKCRIPDTLFTSVQCNKTDVDLGYTARMGLHPDENNVPGAYGVMSVCGNFTGGLLVFPKYEIAVNVRQHDVVIADNAELHGNTQIWAGRRLSIVAFAHTSNCAAPTSGD